MNDNFSPQLEVVKGDITALNVDAIVNAANTSLMGGGGVDGAIHRAAGPGLLKECINLGGCETGSAKITNGYNLPAKYVIHAVGPVWRGGNRKEDKLLKGCYQKCLEIASYKGLKSIAFPCISTGVYRFPKKRAAEIAVNTVKEFFKDKHCPQRVVFVCFSQEDRAVYDSVMK